MTIISEVYLAITFGVLRLLGLLLHHQLDAIKAEFLLQCTQQGHTRTCTGLRHRHHAIAHVLEHMSKVLAVPVHEYAAILAHVLIMSVPAAEINLGVEEDAWNPSQCLHGCLEFVAADIEPDVALLRLLVGLHSCNFSDQFFSLRGHLSNPSGALLSNLGKGLKTLLGHLDKAFNSLLDHP
jgi:hypothetical protein